MVTTETEAAPTESTGPTVNIHTTEAAKPKPVHTSAELTVNTASTEPAEEELECVVMLHRRVSDNSSAVLPADSVNNEKSVLLGSTSSLVPVQQWASVPLKTEILPVPTVLGLDEKGSDSSSLLESAVLNLAAEKANKKGLDAEGGDAGVVGEVLMSEDENYDFKSAVAPAYVREREKEKKMSSIEKEEHNKEESAEGCLDVLELELAGLKHERRQTEVNGKRVQFSNEVQYFKEEQFPTELEDGIEEVDEEVDHCSPAENEGKGNFPDIFKLFFFEKEKYYHLHMDSSEDEMERLEEEETNAKREAQEKYDEEELNMKLEKDCIDKKVFKEEEDVMTSEKEEVVQAEILEKEKTKEQRQKSSPHEVILTEATTSDILPQLPPTVSQTEVTVHQLQ